jgi:hypothetical protein
MPRRSLALVLSLLLPALPASAQVRPIPVEAGSAPLAAPAGFAPAFSLPVSLTLALSAPSLGSAIAPVRAPQPAAAPTVAVRAEASVQTAPAIAVQVKASIPSHPAQSADATERYREEAPLPHSVVEGPAARAVSRAQEAGRAIPDADLNALFDGSAARAGSAAAMPDSGASERRATLLSPKNTQRAKTAAAIAIPVAAAAAVFGAVSPHIALVVLHWLGQGAYWLANPFAFAFTIPQIYTMLSRRSASISTSMITVGFLATAAMAVNMAFDGKDLMLYRNLAQAGGFAAIFILKSLFARASSGPKPSRNRALLETAAIVLAGTVLLFFLGPALAASVPGIAAMHALLVPIQVISGFGFTHLMYAQLTKMSREGSAGDSSPAMMWSYLGTKTIWLWSFATMLSLTTGPAWIVLSLGALFIGVCWFAGQAALSHLLHSPWNFLPQKLTFAGRTMTRDIMSDTVAFVALSALILALSAGGWLAFSSLLSLPAANVPRFLMYLLYTVQSLIACLATMRTLRMRASFDKKSRG